MHSPGLPDLPPQPAPEIWLCLCSSVCETVHFFVAMVGFFFATFQSVGCSIHFAQYSSKFRDGRLGFAKSKHETTHNKSVKYLHPDSGPGSSVLSVLATFWHTGENPKRSNCATYADGVKSEVSHSPAAPCLQTLRLTERAPPTLRELLVLVIAGRRPIMPRYPYGGDDLCWYHPSPVPPKRDFSSSSRTKVSPDGQSDPHHQCQGWLAWAVCPLRRAEFPCLLLQHLSALDDAIYLGLVITTR